MYGRRGSPTSSDSAPFVFGRPADRAGTASSLWSRRYVATSLLIAAGYYAFTELGKALLLKGPAGAFWPSAGLGIAVLYLGGLRWWPAVLLGDLGSLLTDVVHLDLPAGVALAEAIGDLARTIASVVILNRFAGPRITLDRLAQVGVVLVAVVVGGAISATVAMLALLSGGQIETSGMGVFWRSWWLGDVSGGLVILPLALTWVRPRASLLSRRRWIPEGAPVMMAVAALSAVALSASEPMTYLVFPALIWGALRLGSPGAAAAVAFAVLIAVWVTSNELGPFVEHSADESALNLQLYITIAALTTLCLGAVVSERRRAALELARSRARIVAATDAERRRIERDLHDGAQQQLVALRLMVGTADDLMERDPASARRELRELESVIDHTLGQIRSLAAGIYPYALATGGLAEALGSLARRSPIAASVDWANTERYRPEVETAVYFCCSEALQNAAKHARGATTVSIRLERGRELRFEIRDDGAGFSPAEVPWGHGLANMRERLEAVGGTLNLHSAPGEGTRVIGRIKRP